MPPRSAEKLVPQLLPQVRQSDSAVGLDRAVFEHLDPAFAVVLRQIARDRREHVCRRYHAVGRIERRFQSADRGVSRNLWVRRRSRFFRYNRYPNNTTPSPSSAPAAAKPIA